MDWKGEPKRGKDKIVEEEALDEMHALVAHFHATDTVNLASAMKAIISGFVDRSEHDDHDLTVHCEHFYVLFMITRA